MGNPRKAYVLFSKDDFWEIWSCHGNKVTFVGDTCDFKLSTDSERIHNKDAICRIRKALGLTKTYGTYKDFEDYIFMLAV
jgi:hypothetical protein